MTNAKPRGRPRLENGEPNKQIKVTMPSRMYAEVVLRAKSARVTVPEMIRRALHTQRV